MIEYIEDTAGEIIFTMRDSNGNLEPNLSGLSANLSKNGGAFSAVSSAITEIDHGYYKVASGTANFNTAGQCKLYAWKPGTSYRGGTEFTVKPRVSREVFGGTIQYGGAAMAVTFQMLDSNGNPVDGAVTGGAPTQEFRHTDYPWAPIYGAPVYEISPAGQGMYYFNDLSGYINAVRGTVYIRIVSTVKDASALVRYQIV